MQQNTLKKIAEALNVSISTVSRALNDHHSVSENTKEKVRKMATALEYEPNTAALQLRTKKSNVLGVTLPTINNFFYDSFIAAVEEEARKNGYSVMIIQTGDQVEGENLALKHFRQNRVSGLFAAISIETEDLSPFERLKESDIPVVFFDRVPVSAGHIKTCLADEAAAKMAAEEIIRKGKKNVLALFGHPHLSISQQRKSSFISTLQNFPSVRVAVEWPENSDNSYRVFMEAWQKKGRNTCDVVFCMGDMILIGVMRAIQELNLKIPADVSVIGISNGFIPKLYKPTITYVETSGYKLGKLAYEQMEKLLHKQTLQPEVFVESMLVSGESL
ncbi:MAG: LacI family DNA-binding transcriptional regulator [Bacteroidetes bacterium]|nr:LacI family DNA-binding transcriptional regulator [Bacteroidota bacterium]